MISQPTDSTTHKRPPFSLFRKLIVASAVIVLLLGLIFWQPIKRYATDIWHCMTTECNPTGPAASWQEQFAAAESLARKNDPYALLTGIKVWPGAYTTKPWHPNDTLQVNFEYVLTDGSYLTVRLWDSVPSSALADKWGESMSGGLAVYAEFAKDRSAIEAALAQIKLSPRQVVDATFAQAGQTRYFEGKDFIPRINLFLTYATYAATSREKWFVTYEPSPYNDWNYSSILTWPNFAVDTSSGAIENTTRTDESLTPNP